LVLAGWHKNQRILLPACNRIGVDLPAAAPYIVQELANGKMFELSCMVKPLGARCVSELRVPKQK
jgi:hypothetical protein